jgi:hypothetical protein
MYIMNITVKIRAVGVASFVLLLQACVTPPSIPPQVGMDDGIVSAQRIPAKATKVLNGKNVRLAVVLSRNTISNIKYLQESNKSLDAQYLVKDNIYLSLKEKTDPQYIINWVDKSLNANFGEVRFYDSVQQAKDSHPDVFAIVDVYYNPWPQHVEFIESTIKIEFFDRNFHYITLAQGSSKTKADFWEGSGTAVIERDKRQAHVRTDALMSFDASLSKILVNPVGWYPASNANRNE